VLLETFWKGMTPTQHFQTEVLEDIRATNNWPEIWRLDIIEALHKKGTLSDSGNYRGMILLSVISRLCIRKARSPTLVITVV
jgi:hypothetical protein